MKEMPRKNSFTTSFHVRTSHLHLVSSFNPQYCLKVVEVFRGRLENPKKAFAIFTTRSSKGSDSMGSEVPKDVLVDGAKENQRPEGCDVSTWRMSSLKTSNQQYCNQLSAYCRLLEDVQRSKFANSRIIIWFQTFGEKHLYWKLDNMSSLSGDHPS